MQKVITLTSKSGSELAELVDELTEKHMPLLQAADAFQIVERKGVFLSDDDAEVEKAVLIISYDELSTDQLAEIEKIIASAESATGIELSISSVK